MRYREVAGERVSVIGLGTWQFGSRDWGYGDDYARNTAGAIVRRALDLGVNVVDTAEIYAFGRSERIVGEAIAGRREDVFVATKLFPVLPLATVTANRGRASARRLGIDTIDLYQLHAANPLVPVSRAMRGMARLRAAGVIRQVGVSNVDLGTWQGAEESLGGPVLSNQVRFHLLAREPERELLPWAQRSGRLVIAYSPLAQGVLSARFDGSGAPAGYRGRKNPLFRPASIAAAQPLFEALRDIGAAHGVTPAVIALAWLVDHANVVAIPGARTVAQLEANVTAADVTLSPSELHDLDATSAHATAEMGRPR